MKASLRILSKKLLINKYNKKMSLKEQIIQDFKTAFKEKNESKKSVLSMIKAEIKNREIDLILKDEDLSDEEVINLLMRMSKQRNESAESYIKGGRSDLAEKEKEELRIISTYLPKQLSDDEIEEAIKGIVKEQVLTGSGDLGKLMGIATAKLKGRADGKRIRVLAEKLLN